MFSDGSKANHKKKVKQILSRLNDVKLHFDIEKCEFGVILTKYLKFIIEAKKSVRINFKKLRAIRE